MSLAVAERGMLPNTSNGHDFLISLKWQYYGEDLRDSLKSKYSAEEHKEDLEKLYSILEEVGAHLPLAGDKFDLEWFKKRMTESRNLPSLASIDDKIHELRDRSLTDDEQYKSLANFIRNCQRTIKRIVNDEPIYLIPGEREDFLKLSRLLSSPPEKRF